MFTGIIESLGKIIEVSDQGSNRHFRVASDLSDTLKIDQSIAHDVLASTSAMLRARPGGSSGGANLKMYAARSRWPFSSWLTCEPQETATHEQNNKP